MIIDEEAFNQLMELDDDDEHTFSKSIVGDFFSEVDTTVSSMKHELMLRNTQKVSSLGHYLKGGAASIGAAEVRDICDRIQHLDIEANHSLADDLIKQLEISLKTTKKQIYNRIMSL